MNRYLRLILLALIVLSPSCGTNMGGTNMDANRIAQKYWETRLTKCGDSWYGDYLTIYLNEYKNGVVWVEATRLTEADKLNGYEWKGETGMNATAYRQYRGTWQEWHQLTQFYSPLKSMGTTISKKNGRWFFENVEADSFTASPKKLSCDQIPR